MKMRVIETRDVAPDVKMITLGHPKRSELPMGEPGAHVDLRLPDGKVRQYSLCGDPADVSVYRIAVKREEEGRGGSCWVHEQLAAQSEAHVSAPRSNFGLDPSARRHILVAGGIGITPFLSMVHALKRQDADFTLHYCSRNDRPAFLDELEILCGDRLSLHVSTGDSPNRFDSKTAFADPEPHTHTYCCGPESLTGAVREATAHWPAEQVHFEIFQPTADENFNPEPFDIEIASTGKVIRVPAMRSALEVLRDAGFPLPSSCELGVCGSCECKYRDGTVIHRDSVLGVHERQDRMMLCVSRARVRVTLDL